jgi:cytochrome o ubiquinol oxidase subunit 1
LAGLSFVFGFAMVWYMWLVAIVSFAAIVVVAIAHTFNYHRDYYLTADEVRRVETSRTELMARHV